MLLKRKPLLLFTIFFSALLVLVLMIYLHLQMNWGEARIRGQLESFLHETFPHYQVGLGNISLQLRSKYLYKIKYIRLSSAGEELLIEDIAVRLPLFFFLGGQDIQLKVEHVQIVNHARESLADEASLKNKVSQKHPLFELQRFFQSLSMRRIPQIFLSNRLHITIRDLDFEQNFKDLQLVIKNFFHPQHSAVEVSFPYYLATGDKLQIVGLGEVPMWSGRHFPSKFFFEVRESTSPAWVFLLGNRLELTYRPHSNNDDLHFLVHWKAPWLQFNARMMIHTSPSTPSISIKELEGEVQLQTLVGERPQWVLLKRLADLILNDALMTNSVDENQIGQQGQQSWFNDFLSFKGSLDFDASLVLRKLLIESKTIKENREITLQIAPQVVESSTHGYQWHMKSQHGQSSSSVLLSCLNYDCLQGQLREIAIDLAHRNLALIGPALDWYERFIPQALLWNQLPWFSELRLLGEKNNNLKVLHQWNHVRIKDNDFNHYAHWQQLEGPNLRWESSDWSLTIPAISKAKMVGKIVLFNQDVEKSTALYEFTKIPGDLWSALFTPFFGPKWKGAMTGEIAMQYSADQTHDVIGQWTVSGDSTVQWSNLFSILEQKSENVQSAVRSLFESNFQWQKILLKQVGAQKEIQWHLGRLGADSKLMFKEENSISKNGERELILYFPKNKRDVKGYFLNFGRHKLQEDFYEIKKE